MFRTRRASCKRACAASARDGMTAARQRRSEIKRTEIKMAVKKIKSE
jgi:hypothetical protein